MTTDVVHADSQPSNTQPNTNRNPTMKLRLRNDLYCVEWGVKLYSLTHPHHEMVDLALAMSRLTDELFNTWHAPSDGPAVRAAPGKSHFCCPNFTAQYRFFFRICATYEKFGNFFQGL